MRELAPGVHQLAGLPPNAINCYLVGDVLIDAGARLTRSWLVGQLRGRTLAAHALTHAHADHQGGSAAVCARFDVPFWVGAGDVAAAAVGGDATGAGMPRPMHPIAFTYMKLFAGPGWPVSRTLGEGDEVAGFTVLETPGHSSGHLAFWRESDRTLIAGDVFTTMNVSTLLPGLHEPQSYFTPDPARNRVSLRRLAELRPALALVGHGPPLRDPGKLAEFAASLPD